MKRSVRTIVSRALLIALIAAGAESRSDELYADMGNWRIVYSDEYKGCVALAEYNSGTAVTYGVDGMSRSRFINFGNSGWEFPLGQDFKVDFQVPGSAKFTGYFHTVERQGKVAFENGDLTDGFVAAVQGANSMSMFVEGRYLTSFSLYGTNAAFNSVSQCERARQ